MADTGPAPAVFSVSIKKHCPVLRFDRKGCGQDADRINKKSLAGRPSESVWQCCTSNDVIAFKLYKQIQIYYDLKKKLKIRRFNVPAGCRTHNMQKKLLDSPCVQHVQKHFSLSIPDSAWKGGNMGQT